MKYLIVGGVAGGATAAARIRRNTEKDEIILFEKGDHISYANCGLPYYVGGVIADRDRLFVQTPEAFGRRFRIVHLFFGSKIIEVTTFRSDEENFEDGRNNVYGSIEQDAKRRDFSINSLYYDPSNGQLLDFNDAMEDFRRRQIRSLIPLSYSFSEDPVRMIRALKYQATTGFALRRDVRHAIKRNASRIEDCSTSRLKDEVSKLLS